MPTIHNRRLSLPTIRSIIRLHDQRLTNSILPLKKNRRTNAPTTGVYVCGHNHIHSIAERKHWCFVQIAAAWDVPSYRLLTVQEQTITIELKTIDDPELDELIRRFQQQMDGFTHIPRIIAQSEEDTQRHTFDFAKVRSI